MIWITAAVASLLVTQVYGAPGSIMRNLMGSNRASLERRMEETAYRILEKRQSADTSTNTTAWDTETLAACQATLSALPSASNPSGMAVCYNVAQLNTTAGEFMADLRLFEVSAPSGAWSGIPLQQMKGSISFTGATASEINGQRVATRDVLSTRQSTGPTLRQTYMIVGKINQDQMVPPMTIQKIEPLIMPIFTLRATDATGQTVATNVSSNEAAFVNGIFSKEVVLSPFNIASQAQQAAVADLKAGKIAFVLPGVNILIFPVGLIVTSFWAMVGISVYAFGTYERYNYRESYRRRKAMAGSKSYTTRI
ncbi:putative ribosome-recycling factor [Rosellinia necatrix]|uniref:Putative ribosome-recycling factor n=1 Tax=Rosellinia necatrix TaxID=77044 RepID=A0A1W2TFX6_ROSNE|nr:putative ribosome-recycling factor [Rosellinia necatrix]